ncbi:arylamine N-acetyltransferase [Antrihabitans sp. YC3-6]|uniref:Arylamine N-acetyltransferase n=1 Tax=Antrihabitans stalagmiti TaxID=2799499 RepID=A0A934NWK7_9NOCA|nr:arylamine N-acetyltransferase [Antrihabitans stalagmiti]MBJ8342532.1 arylamine N-acetyltransferase [Antrihabitans stalagmiti]
MDATANPVFGADLDLDAYFARIGYSGSRTPTVATLGAIAYAHATTIAFENLDPFLGTPARLDLASLQRKIVGNRRGGYCFEQNGLLLEVLEKLGFDVTPLAARVLWSGEIDAVPKRSHMLLRVDIDGRPWVVDVGFGGMTLTGVLSLERDVEQATPHEPFRVIDLDGDYAMQAKVRDTWKTTYRFDLQRQYRVDYVATNWYLSTSPESGFVQGLMLARPAADRRFALNGRRLAVHHLDGPTERTEFTTAAGLIECLEETFLVHMPDWRPLETAFGRLT